MSDSYTPPPAEARAPEVMVNAKVPADMAEALKARAAAEDRSVSAVVRRALADYLSRPADAA